MDNKTAKLISYFRERYVIYPNWEGEEPYHWKCLICDEEFNYYPIIDVEKDVIAYHFPSLHEEFMLVAEIANIGTQILGGS